MTAASTTSSAPEPRRLWCRCRRNTAWRTSRGWVLRYRCVNGVWGGGGGYGNGASLKEAYRWCASCRECRDAAKGTP
jgi:hypothetical protein